MDKLIHKLGQLLSVSVSGEFKYLKSRFALVKKLTDGAQIITIDLLPASEEGKAKLAMHAHIRLDKLEKLYGPFHPFLSKKDQKTHSTLVVNCDHLFSDKSLIYSIDIEEGISDEIVDKFSLAIRKDILPFFEKYYSIVNLVSSFEKTDPSYWVSSDRNTRSLVLLSAYFIESRWDDFDRVANEYLDYCNQPFAQAYKPLAESVINGLRSKRVDSTDF